MARYKFGPWAKHDGKGIPVDGDTLVCVKFFDGEAKYWERNPTEAKHWEGVGLSNWIQLDENDGPAIAEYRIVQREGMNDGQD